MQKLFQKIERFIFRKTFREIEVVVISMIDDSEGKEEKLYEFKGGNLKAKWSKFLFKMYSIPPKCPVAIKVKLNRYSEGQNWEYFWSKACFLLLSKLQFKNHLSKIKKVIEKNHIWYSFDAMNLLILYSDFFNDESNIEFIKRAIQKKGDWASLVYIKSLATLKSKPLVNKLISEQIEERLIRRNQDAYLQIYYLIKGLIESDNPLKNEYSYYLYDVANFEDTQNIIKYSDEFKFANQMRARSIISYLSLNPENINANFDLENWIRNESDEEILRILNKDIN